MSTPKPGQSITCTVIKTPTNKGGKVTLTRLMQMDPAIKRGLRRAHHLRQQNLNVYNRGNRDWTSRVACGKIVRPIKGQSWTMTYSVNIADELASLAKFIEFKAA